MLLHSCIFLHFPICVFVCTCGGCTDLISGLFCVPQNSTWQGQLCRKWPIQRQQHSAAKDFSVWILPFFYGALRKTAEPTHKHEHARTHAATHRHTLVHGRIKGETESKSGGGVTNPLFLYLERQEEMSKGCEIILTWRIKTHTQYTHTSMLCFLRCIHTHLQVFLFSHICTHLQTMTTLTPIHTLTYTPGQTHSLLLPLLQQNSNTFAYKRTREVHHKDFNKMAPLHLASREFPAWAFQHLLQFIFTPSIGIRFLS